MHICARLTGTSLRRAHPPCSSPPPAPGCDTAWSTGRFSGWCGAQASPRGRTPAGHGSTICGDTFAVQTLLDAYRNGWDVQERLALLSTYLGHVNPAGTYWYLSAAPELLGLAADRLANRRGVR